jgi:hypothetical protein
MQVLAGMAGMALMAPMAEDVASMAMSLAMERQAV